MTIQEEVENILRNMTDKIIQYIESGYDVRDETPANAFDVRDTDPLQTHIEQSYVEDRDVRTIRARATKYLGFPASNNVAIALNDVLQKAEGMINWETKYNDLAKSYDILQLKLDVVLPFCYLSGDHDEY